MEAPYGNLPCMNCGETVKRGEERTFLAVFVCRTCFLFAGEFRLKLQKQLEQLLLLADEAIREKLVKGELHPSPAQPIQDVPKSELLTQLRNIMEVHGASRNSPGSSDSSKPAEHASAAGEPVRQDDRDGVGEQAAGPVGLLGDHPEGELVPVERDQS